MARSLRAAVAAELKWSILWLLYQVDNLAVRRRLAQQIMDGVLYGMAAREAILREARKARGGGRPVGAGAKRAFDGVKRILERFKKRHDFDRAKLRTMDEATARATVEEGEEAAEVILGVVSDIKREFDI